MRVHLLVAIQTGISLVTDGFRTLPSVYTSPCVASLVQSAPNIQHSNWMMLASLRGRTLSPSPATLSRTPTVCDEARGRSSDVTNDDQAHVNPYPFAQQSFAAFESPPRGVDRTGAVLPLVTSRSLSAWLSPHRIFEITLTSPSALAH